jgi:hypothetical protein
MKMEKTDYVRDYANAIQTINKAQNAFTQAYMITKEKIGYESTATLDILYSYDLEMELYFDYKCEIECMLEELKDFNEKMFYIQIDAIHKICKNIKKFASAVCLCCENCVECSRCEHCNDCTAQDTIIY